MRSCYDSVAKLVERRKLRETNIQDGLGAFIFIYFGFD